jgi:flagellar motor switch protein FliM
MPGSAARIVDAVVETAPRVGLMLGLASGRTVTAACPGVRRMALVELAAPGSIWITLGSNLSEQGLLVLSAPDAISLADLLLGGPGNTVADRAATPLEQELVRHHLVPALRPIGEVLPGVGPLHAGQVSDEPLPVGGGEVLAVPVQLDLPAGRSVTVTVCFPARSVLPAAEAAPTIMPMSPDAARVLVDAPISVTLYTQPAAMPAADLADLAPGDVVRLDPHATEALIGLVDTGSEPLPILLAALGRRGKHRAVVVHDLLGYPTGGTA